MSFSAGPSPVWLGVVAILSFGGLVLASFASGYHLVGDPPAAARAGSAPAEAPSIRSARVREDVPKARAVARASPEEGEVVGQLRPEQSVSVLAEKGAWVQIRYEQGGVAREGWTESVNLSSDED